MTVNEEGKKLREGEELLLSKEPYVMTRATNTNKVRVNQE
jgi:hypothetical protein